MEKTLNIIPSGTWWPLIVKNWIGNGPDKADYEVIQYPVPTNFHYLPEALTDDEEYPFLMERVREIVREMKPELKESPLFQDDTPDMTISYIVDRLFHLVSGKK